MAVRTGFDDPATTVSNSWNHRAWRLAAASDPPSTRMQLRYLVSAMYLHLITARNVGQRIYQRVKFDFPRIALPIFFEISCPVKSQGAYVRLDPVWAS